MLQIYNHSNVPQFFYIEDNKENVENDCNYAYSYGYSYSFDYGNGYTANATTNLTCNFYCDSTCKDKVLRYTDPDGEWIHIPIMAAIGGIINVASNWKNIDGFWQGFAAFNVGAGQGALTAVCPAAGAIVGTGITSATNNLIAQTGNNFSGINNVNWAYVGLSGAIGAFTGAATYGIGQGFGPTGTFMNELGRGLAHGALQGSMSAMQGGNFWQGFASGALSSWIGHGAEAMGLTNNIAGSLAVSSLAGGVGSWAAGGDFWQGAANGFMVGLLNQVQLKKGDKWKKGDPTMIRNGKKVFVVHNSTGEYIELTDRSLKREFDMVYRERKNIKGKYWSPISDIREFEILMGVYASSINPFPLFLIPATQTPDMSTVSNAATIRYYGKLIKYYQEYNIIK